MEKVNFNYSTKNIPVPSRNLYRQMVIAKSQKFIHNARWKAHFFLNPQDNPSTKNNFGFKSTNPAPIITQLKFFEEQLVKLVKNIKFGRKPNNFQNELKKDEKIIKSDKKAFIKANGD